MKETDSFLTIIYHFLFHLTIPPSLRQGKARPSLCPRRGVGDHRALQRRLLVPGREQKWPTGSDTHQLRQGPLTRADRVSASGKWPPGGTPRRSTLSLLLLVAISAAAAAVGLSTTHPSALAPPPSPTAAPLPGPLASDALLPARASLGRECEYMCVRMYRYTPVCVHVHVHAQRSG